MEKGGDERGAPERSGLARVVVLGGCRMRSPRKGPSKIPDAVRLPVVVCCLLLTNGPIGAQRSAWGALKHEGVQALGEGFCAR